MSASIISSAALISLLEAGGGAFMGYARALSGLSDVQARVLIEGSPHSAADILGHLNFWQAWALDKIAGKTIPVPEHAEGGWPKIGEGEWENLVETFLAGLEACKALAKDEAKLGEAFFWGKHEMTVGNALLSTAVHNAHHLGQIILLRRIMGAWPPEGGMYTW
ncbi:MAG: DinB family protein [Anaerolineae bacterium]|nr:DinB family protein [Anaerolineae bacterium]